MAGNEWSEAVNRAALSRCPAILGEWIPGGRVNGREYEAASVNGGAGHSFKCNVENGKWKDYASGEAGGGNLIALYARVRGIEWKEALYELAKDFGIERPKPVHLVTQQWEPVIPVPDFAPFDEQGQPTLPPLRENLRDAALEGIWCYLDADGQPIRYRVRFQPVAGKKEALPLTFCRNPKTGETGWRWRDIAPPRGLYGLEYLAVMPTSPVLVVEGEKSADAARRLLPEWACITWSSGVEAVRKKYTDWSPVLNRNSRIVLWPDADAPGLKAMAELSDILEGRCQLVQPDRAWREGWDLADAEAEGWDSAKVLEYLERHLITPQSAPKERLAVDISGQDLELQSRAVWQGVQAVNDPPELFYTTAGLALVSRDEYGKAEQKVATKERLLHWLTKRLEFKKLSKVGEHFQLMPCRPGDTLIGNLLVYQNPPIPFLDRLAEVPIATPDNRLLVTEGYDRPSGIYYLPLPSLAAMQIDREPPNSDEIEGSIALLDDLMADFPFVADVDRAHAYSFLLTPILRQAIDGPTPLHRFEAPQAGTGKSLLMRTLAAIPCCTVSDMGPCKDEEEWRKRITAALRQYPDAFLIDNAENLESANLKKLITDTFWQDRALQFSEVLRYRVQCTFGVSLNNPVISREIMRRSLRVRLDAKAERPEQRTPAGGFRHEQILEYARVMRAELVAAVVTIAKATPAAYSGPILGGFESYCRLVGGILQAVGIKGFLGDRQDESALNDTETGLQLFVKRWADDFAGAWVRIDSLLQIAEGVDSIYLGRADSDRGKKNSLSRFIGKHRGATVGDWQILEPTRRHGETLFALRRTGADVNASESEVNTGEYGAQDSAF